MNKQKNRDPDDNMQLSELRVVWRTLTHRPETKGFKQHLNFVRWSENAARSRTGFRSVSRG